MIGAGGFIGGRVARMLRDQGAERLRAGARDAAGAARLAAEGFDAVACDIADRAALAVAMAGIEVVINCARGGDVAAILTAARAAGVRRVIHLSSASAYGSASGRVTEATAPVPPLDAYTQDKLAGEAACRAAAEAPGGPEVVVLRPGLVYGPGGEEWTLRFARDILDGTLARLGPAGAGEANLVHVDDLARFCGHLAVANLPRFLLVNVAGDDPPSFNTYFDSFTRALGAPPLAERRVSRRAAMLRKRLRAIGRAALRRRPAALRSGLAGRLLRPIEAALRPGPRDDHPSRYAGRIVYANDLAKAHGFDPATSLEEGLKSSAAWAKRVLRPAGAHPPAATTPRETP